MENLSEENTQSEENLPKENILPEQISEVLETKIEETILIKESFWQKFRIFFLDIAVVVIGVTLSTLLNDQINDHNQRKDVKKFLLGLKVDFINDVQEMEDDKKSFNGSSRVFSYLTHVKKNEMVSKDTVKNIGMGFLFNITALIPNDGRYEGFKSAGKINTIENDSLQNDILDLYQEDMQALLSSTNRHTESKKKFTDYIEDNRVRENDTTTNLYKLLGTEKCYQLCRSLENTSEIIDRYNKCINKMKKIISQIDKQYK